VGGSILFGWLSELGATQYNKFPVEVKSSDESCFWRTWGSLQGLEKI
jgi:hypothetical protein